MAILCVGNELFYLFLYGIHFYPIQTPLYFNLVFYWVLLPTFGMKQFMNILQLFSSMVDIVDWETQMQTNIAASLSNKNK